MATTVQVTFDCADPGRVARFWAVALGYRFPSPPDGHATWEDALRASGVPEERWNSASALEDPEGTGPRLYFQRVPEPKESKNRLHLDLRISGGPQVERAVRRDRIEAEAQRLEGEGAVRLRWSDPEQIGDLFLIMQDPDGNEFCLT